MHVISKESIRDNAMTRTLVDVQDAVKNWAENTADGALVWHIANEFRELWHDWGLALLQPIWQVPGFVISSLNKIASDTEDDVVRESVRCAKQAMLAYRE